MLGIIGVILTLLMAAAVVYYRQAIEGLGAYGYLGAFIISVMGGATIIIPIPMLAVVFALGGVLKYTWLLGLVSGLGETVGALTIYMTGYGGGAAIAKGVHGKLQVAYERMIAQMEKRGSWTLFLLSSVINPFFYPAALAAGALRFSVVKYFIVCWAGKTIKGMTVAYAGYYGLRGILRALGVPL